jgi:integrase
LDLIDTIREGRETGLLFSINHRSVSAAFTRACAILGIEDLHFHDLRHEATSRLFEDGLMIQEVATYTLHDSWAALKVYANIMERHERFDPSDLITPRSPASTP